MGRSSAVSGGIVVLAILMAMSWGRTAAHEQRDVGEGRYSLTVGFVEEPAYVGIENGLYLKVVALTGEAGPVEGLAGALTAEVVFGDRTMPLALLPLPNDPGVYEGRFIPTQAGDYTFRLAGQFGEQVIDETFRSSPNTFDAVKPATAAQFPAPVPAGADLAAELEQANDDAASARTLAIVGIVAGVVGLLVALVVAGAALRRRVA